ncbi:MAG: FecR domain-containing protein [Cyclobacteriaceae bacterium]|nr:FecR domain-containing protein [Cyclobacteriaceae bacterium]
MKRPIPNYPDELIAKFLSGNASAGETHEVLEWASAHPDHARLLESMKEVWRAKSDLPEVDVDKAWKNFERKISSSEGGDKKIVSMPFRWGMRVAAVLLLGVFIMIGYQLIKTKPSEINLQAFSGHLDAHLPDGSAISLRDGSQLSYVDNFSDTERRVKLSGEAFFDVVPDPVKPFIVEMEALDVAILGTSFYTLETVTFAEVGVKKGLVAVGRKNSDQWREVRAGQKIRFDKISESFEEIAQFEENRVYWKTGLLLYRNTSLSKVIAELEDIFNATIHTEGNVSDCKLTGRFEGETLEQILNAIKLHFGLEIEYGDTIKITSKGC